MVEQVSADGEGRSLHNAEKQSTLCRAERGSHRAEKIFMFKFFLFCHKMCNKIHKVNMWVWQCSNQTLFLKAGRGPNLAGDP